tara:strand:+ start:484 stop:954 length:471 start_codon:yes stop_codon:yes gene_type:complete
MSKQIYSWGQVTAGDIISFRYKPLDKLKPKALTTILVLNPKLPNKKKSGKLSFHLVGLKLEERLTIPTIRSKPLLVALLLKTGEIEVIDESSGIFRVEIPGVTPKGAPRNVYKKLKTIIQKNSLYRTYDYKQAKKSGVFLEPIVLPKKFVEVLVEN